MVAYRLSRAAEDDIVSILAWSQDEFGVDARHRYAALIAAALRDAAGRGLGAEPTARPELGPDVL